MLSSELGIDEAALLRGDRIALRAIFDALASHVYRSVRARVHDDMIVEEVVQDAFLHAFRDLPRLASFESVGALRAFVTRLARNQAVHIEHRLPRRVVFDESRIAQ